MTKIKGGVLVYVVVMSLVVFLVIGLMLSRDYQEYSRLDLVVERDWIRDQVRSVVVILEKEPEILDTMRTILPGLPVRARIYREKWGLLELVTVDSSTPRLQDTTVLSCMEVLAIYDSTALYLAGNLTYLSIAGDTELRGICYLPSLGIRRGYVQGQGYYKDTLVYGEIRLSADTLPRLASRHVIDFDEWYSFQESFDVEENMNCSFKEKEVVCYSRFSMVLEDNVLKGKIKLISEEKITVRAGCKITDCILVAPNIEIEKGFSGRLQLFASEKIKLDTGVFLTFPSVVYLRSPDRTTLQVCQKANVTGSVIVVGSREALCLMERDAVIQGQLYNEGCTQLEGEIDGSIYTGKLRFYNEWGQHEDIILGGKVDRFGIPAERPAWNLFEEDSKRIVINMLE